MLRLGLDGIVFVLVAASGWINFVDTLTADRWSQTRIHFKDVSHRYEETFLRNLMSSVPRREYSVQNINLDLVGLVLFTGSSSSGKSTLFKLIQGDIEPDTGTVTIDTEGTQSAPVYLDQKPLLGNGKRTLTEFICDELGPQQRLNQKYLVYVADLFGFSPWNLENTILQELSQSQIYNLSLTVASLKSCPGWDVGAPILLLDEWLDKEASAVIHGVQKKLEKAAHDGALIGVITHRPERWRAPCRNVVMSYGRLQRDNAK